MGRFNFQLSAISIQLFNFGLADCLKTVPQRINMPSSTTIALIGYRGTGKTTVARLLAEQLDFSWVDADDEIEARADQSIADLFAESGEEVFRELEAVVVAALCEREKTIIAMGGGAILREGNRKNLSQCQAVVWLKASAEAIEKRISTDPTTGARRPNLTNHGGRTEIDVLLAQREPIYRACATLEVDTEDRAPTEIAADIAAQL
jgi:shikimate kinase